MRLENRVAMVTAAGSGMGRAGARRFAQEGAHVVVSDLDESAAKETVALIEADGGSAEAHQLNVTDLEQVSSILKSIERTHGALHVLYNHAGIPGAAGLEMSPEAVGAWRLTSTEECLLRGLVRATDLLRRAEGKGSIIFTASDLGPRRLPFQPAVLHDQGRHRASHEIHGAQPGAAISVPTRSAPGRSTRRCCRKFFGRTPDRGRGRPQARGFMPAPCRWAGRAQPERDRQCGAVPGLRRVELRDRRGAPGRRRLRRALN